MISKKSQQKQKRHNHTPLCIFLFLFPYIVGFTSDSTSSFSQLSIGAGAGQYVYHDCSGVHKQSFGDAGIYIGKKFEGPYRIGISAGGWSAGEQGSHGIAFPDLALDWDQFSIGTTGLRIGSEQTFYIEGKWLDQPPYLSGKGIIRFGIGGRFAESDSRLWIGTNVIPYTTEGVAMQYEFPYAKNKYLFINGRIGSERQSGMSEYGFSVGVRMKTF